jgi:hypothetical protein
MNRSMPIVPKRNILRIPSVFQYADKALEFRGKSKNVRKTVRLMYYALVTDFVIDAS